MAMKISGIPLVVVTIVILAIFSGCIGAGTDASGNNSVKTTILKNTKKGTANISNDTVPPSPVSYLQVKRGDAWLNLTWENPQDADYNLAMIFINGKFNANVPKSKNYYNLTKLAADTQYRIGIRTVDVNKNIGLEWINVSTSTLPKYKDQLPPDKIWYLEAHASNTSINWTWENPADADYSYANVIVDGKFAGNVSKSKNYYLKKGLEPNTEHTISIRTVDRNKNMNMNSVVDLASTLP
jgi:hypothetical protein